MNIFAEGIIKYDNTIKIAGVHNIGIHPPLPLGSAIKFSRLYLDNDEQPTPDLFDRLCRELFVDSRMCDWSKEGVFVHVVAAPPIITSNDGTNWTIRRRKLLTHCVKEALFHLIECRDEYEWWQGKELLDTPQR